MPNPISIYREYLLNEAGISDRATLVRFEYAGYPQQVADALNSTIVHRHSLTDRSIWKLRDVVFDSDTGVHYLDGHPLQESLTAGIKKTLPLLKRTWAKSVQCHSPTIAIARSPQNYYHWLLEDLPAVLRARSFAPQADVLVNARSPKFVASSLAQLGIFPVGVKGVIKAEELLFPARGPDAGWHHKADLTLLRERVLDGAVFDGSPSEEKLYVSRRFSTRPLINEREVEVHMANLGFAVIYAEELSFAEQVRLFSRCSLVVGPHGAGLANIVFAKPGARVVELALRTNANQCFETLANELRLNYSRVFLSPSSRPESAFADLKTFGTLRGLLE